MEDKLPQSVCYGTEEETEGGTGRRVASRTQVENAFRYWRPRQRNGMREGSWVHPRTVESQGIKAEWEDKHLPASDLLQGWCRDWRICNGGQPSYLGFNVFPYQHFLGYLHYFDRLPGLILSDVSGHYIFVLYSRELC